MVSSLCWLSALVSISTVLVFWAKSSLCCNSVSVTSAAALFASSIFTKSSALGTNTGGGSSIELATSPPPSVFLPAATILQRCYNDTRENTPKKCKKNKRMSLYFSYTIKEIPLLKAVICKRYTIFCFITRIYTISRYTRKTHKFTQ